MNLVGVDDGKNTRNLRRNLVKLGLGGCGQGLSPSLRTIVTL